MYVPETVYDTLGFEVLEAAGGVARVGATDLARLGNREGWVHGGAIAALCDAALTQAAGSTDALGQGSATAELQVSYLEPARSGPLVASADVVGVFERRVEVRAEVRAQGSVVAVARALISRGRMAGPQGSHGETSGSGS